MLKVLYESVIKPEVRKTLGKYYTPDWLANRVLQGCHRPAPPARPGPVLWLRDLRV